VLVPAQAVFLDASLWAEPQFMQMTSCGLASGPSTDATIASGLHECIERDAFSSRWLLGQAGNQMPDSAIDSMISPALRAIVVASNCELRVNDLTTDLGVPVYAASLRSRGKLRGVVYGAAANSDPAVAMEKAVIEVFQSLCWAIQAVETRNIEQMQEADIAEFMDHAAYYLDSSRADSIEWFRSGMGVSDEQPRAMDDGPRASALETILARGYEPVFIDITNSNLRNIDMCAGRVIVPGLQPLHAGHGLEPRDRRRLDRLSGWLGVASAGSLNFRPHPFP
jgi:ribosomal protein S12 methylthiotransferase accessory factor